MTEAEELELLRLRAKAAGTPAPDPAPEPSEFDSAVAGVGQLGSFGFGDEIGAAGQALAMKLSGKGEFGETYRQARDENRAEDKAAAKAHPGFYYGAGAPVAAVASLPLQAVRLGEGAALLTRAVGGGINAGALGALSGAGSSEAETAGGVVGDTAIGGVGGAALGGALPVAGAAVRLGLSPLKRPATAAGNWLEDKAVNIGRRVLTNGADQLSTREPVRADAVANAIRQGGIRAFGTTKGAHDRLRGLSSRQYVKYNQVVEALAEKGVRGPEAQVLAQKLLAEAAEIEANSTNKALPALYRDVAEQVRSPAKVGGVGGAGPGAQRLGLVQSENIKRDLQAQAKFGRVDETPLNEARRDVASVVRLANEEAIEEQAQRMGPDVRSLASGFVPVKKEMGRLIEATSAARRGAARGAQRSFFGLKDIMAALAAAGTGNPGLAAPVALASHAGHNRLPSALASFGLGTADALRRSGPVSSNTSQALQALIQALREAPQDLEGGE